MTEAALRTAQAARFLNISADTLRKLSRLGLIETEQSPGGHARYPLPALERMKRDGVPEIPCELQAADDDPEPECELEQHQPSARDTVRNGQAAELPDDDNGPPPSDAVAAAEDEATIEEYRARTDEISLKRLQLKLEREQVTDQFRAREQRDRQAQEGEQARQRAEAENQARAQEWRAFLKRWLEYAVSRLPPDLDGPSQLAILEGVAGALQKLGQDVTEWTARRAVDTQIEFGLEPWHSRKQIDALIETACGRLPTGMRNDATWRFRAIEAATRALKALRPEANQFEKQTAVEHAMNLVKADFEYLERRESIVRNTWIRDASSDERDAARDSVRQAIEELPIGSSDRELEAARDRALAPYLSAIRTRKDREMRANLLPNWLFNYVPPSIEEALKKELQKGIDAHPEGTPQRQLERVRDQIIDKRRSERRTKEALINGGLNQIAVYMQTLRKEWEIPHDLNGPWNVVREYLEQEITHETPAEEVARLVRRKIRRYFRIR